MMLDDLLLLSGNDIPFEKAKLIIHQPTIKEIAYIGEEPFFIGCELLNFSKDILSFEDKNSLQNNSNFEVFMSIMHDRQNKMLKRNRTCALMVLSLMFPEYKIQNTTNSLVFVKENDENNKGELNNDNFEDFKIILNQMFCLEKTKGNSSLNYNPKDSRSREIAIKLEQGRRKVAEAKHEVQKISIFSRYISILSIGQFKTFEELLHYTVYQLFDAFNRFELKEAQDIYLRAQLAGAKDLEEVDNWMKDIHDKGI